MNRNKNHKTFIATILFTCLVGLAALSIASAQIPDLFSNDTEVLVYGDEQAIVNAITEKNKPQKINKKHQNELDHVFFILLRRAHPKPKPERLLRHTINAMCRKIENITKTKVPDSQRNTWITTATQANGFQTVLESMANFGSKKTKQKELIDTGISAMLRATGCSYATVLSKNRAKQITDMLQKRNTPNQNPKTLGIDVSKWPIIKTIPGTPATVAGLKDGDVILKANNKEIAQKEEILKILRAKRNTSIRLTVKRKNKILTFEVYRDPAAMMVKARVVDQNIVYIKIPLFEGSGIAGRVKKLIHEHVTDTTQAIILDLRDNPGGRPEEVNAVADLFLDNQYLQIYQFGNGKLIIFKSKPGSLHTRLIVLTNKTSGCGAEILAMTLQDHHRATVIGQPTAGILSGHDFEKLSDGRMIVFRAEPTVLSPNGKDYSDVGISPDILVKPSPKSDKDKILDRAIQHIQNHPSQDAIREQKQRGN